MRGRHTSIIHGMHYRIMQDGRDGSVHSDISKGKHYLTDSMFTANVCSQSSKLTPPWHDILLHRIDNSTH